MSEYYVNPNPTPGSGTTFSDREVHFPTPVRRLILASKNAGGNLFVHTSPLGKVANATGFIPINGQEKWLNLGEFRSIQFKNPLQSLFFTGDGSPPDFSVIGTTDIDDIELTPAPNGADILTINPNGGKLQLLLTGTPLGAGASFVSPWFDSLITGTIYVALTAVSNVNISTLSLQESEDQINVRIIAQSATSTVLRAFGDIRQRYWRVICTATGAQASLSVYASALSQSPVSGQPASTGGIVELFPIAIGTSLFANDLDNQRPASQSINEAPSMTSGNAPFGVAVMSLPIFGGAFSGTADTARQGWSRMRTPTVFRTVQASAAGSTALWTPGANNKFRILKVFIDLTDNASLAVAGVLTIQLFDGANPLPIAVDAFVPVAAGGVAGDALHIGMMDLGCFGILSAAVNNVLNVNLSVALVTGNVRVIVAGTEE